MQPPSSTHGQGRNGTKAGMDQPPEFQRRAGLGMVTDLVKLRKLTRDLVANFPALDAEACVAKKGDI